MRAFIIKQTEKILSFLCYVLFPFHKKRIVFISMNGHSYADNPRSIYEALIAHELPKDIEIVWFIDEMSIQFPKYVKVVSPSFLNYVYYLATSKIWVSNFGMPQGIYKSSKHYYIQTWHGDKAFKRILLDVENHIDGETLFESKNMDLLLSGSKFFDKIARSAFNYQGEILTVGSPRNDRFFTNCDSIKENVRNLYGIDAHTRVLLFAPTFRDNDKKNKTKQAIPLDFEKVHKILTDNTNEKWVILVRAHMGIRKRGLDTQKSNNILDVTSYPEMNELLLITDVLVTDYSSSAGDFIWTDKLNILYQYDTEEYNKERGHYFDISTSPYICVKDANAFYDTLKRVNTYDVVKNCRQIQEFWGCVETGHSSKEVVNRIVGIVS